MPSRAIAETGPFGTQVGFGSGPAAGAARPGGVDPASARSATADAAASSAFRIGRVYDFGAMFWFTRKTFSGSYSALIVVRRS